MTAPLLAQLLQAKNAFEDAQIAYCGAVVAHAEARRGLELAEAQKLCTGVEGKNERERAAKLRLELATQYSALAEAEDGLAGARCGLEVARLEWELARYNVRVLEVREGNLLKAA